MLPLHVTLSVPVGFNDPTSSQIRLSYKPTANFFSPETIAYDFNTAIQVSGWAEILPAVNWTIAAENEQYSGQIEAVRRQLETEILLNKQGDSVVE